jgi:hypothetical protein
MERIKKNIVSVGTIHGTDDDGFMPGTPASRIEAVWEITRDAWSFRGGEHAERRLQRDVVAVVRRKS